jgi:CheY-like chemotaxis protein
VPACNLYCEHCKTESIKDLDDTGFGMLLDQGAVRLDCSTCNRRTDWKLKLQGRPPRPARPPHEPVRILVVDDDVGTLRVLHKMMTSGGYAADVASSADEAMGKLQEGEFDVIVSDIKMPGFGGPHLFRFLNVFMPEQAAKVVFLTGDLSEQTKKFLQESGCPYSYKPINWPELKARIAEIA